MSWMEPVITRFCQDLGLEVGETLPTLVQLELAQSGTLQLEQHDGQLTLWLARALPWHQSGDAMVRAMTLTAAHNSGALPLRCAWLGDDRLLLLVTLEESAITQPLLHQAFESLLRLQQEVLAS